MKVMPEENNVPLIPTRYREDLAKGSSYPCGAQAFSAALHGLPQFTLLSLSFHGHFDRRRAIPLTGRWIVLSFNYRQIPPSLSSDDNDRWGMRGPKWEITVYPLLSTHRKGFRDYLDRSGFATAAAWLQRMWALQGRDGRAGLVFYIDHSTSEITTSSSEEMQPAR
jgi:hypothetical protein